MYILGISAFYHDSAACLVQDGKIIAAAQEERFTRKKHDADFPRLSIEFCLSYANITADQIDYVVFYEKPFLKFERLIETYLSFAPKGLQSFTKAMPVWLRDKLFQKTNLISQLEEVVCSEIDWSKRLLFSEHHLSHAASAFFPSPFDNAAVLVIDGVGEWATTSLCLANNNNIRIIKEIKFPHSLGLLYSAFTYYTGFRVNSGEYKVMGLAPYGDPKYVNLIKEKLVSISEDGSFQLNMEYFNFATNLTMTNKKFHDLFGGPPRKPESEVTQRDMDLAASIQKVTEEIIIKLAKDIATETGQRNLCLAGGVALNCVVNGILAKEKIFENIWIQPAAGDAGGSLGAALSVWHMKFDGQRIRPIGADSMQGAYLGPEFSVEEIEADLKEIGARYKKMEMNDLLDDIAFKLAKGKAVGWMQGRMEFGPRALGARSILADPRSPKMQNLLNMKVKYRESFRPFAPSVLFEKASEWFDLDEASPYMLLVCAVQKSQRHKTTREEENLFGIDKLNVNRSTVPAVTHVDYTARVQTVHKETNPLYYQLIDRFNELTSCPILANTSFNVRGEPIVCSPIDAFKCFMGTDLDILVIGNFVMEKDEQDSDLRINYRNNYDLD